MLVLSRAEATHLVVSSLTVLSHSEDSPCPVECARGPHTLVGPRDTERLKGRGRRQIGEHFDSFVRDVTNVHPASILESQHEDLINHQFFITTFLAGQRWPCRFQFMPLPEPNLHDSPRLILAGTKGLKPIRPYIEAVMLVFFASLRAAATTSWSFSRRNLCTHSVCRHKVTALHQPVCPVFTRPSQEQSGTGHRNRK